MEGMAPKSRIIFLQVIASLLVQHHGPIPGFITFQLKNSVGLLIQKTAETIFFHVETDMRKWFSHMGMIILEVPPRKIGAGSQR
jgi:hypothetical protein